MLAIKATLFDNRGRCPGAVSAAPQPATLEDRETSLFEAARAAHDLVELVARRYSDGQFEALGDAA